MSSYVYKRKKNMIGCTILNLKANKVPFQKSDIVYICNEDDKLHSRWLAVGRNDKTVQLRKRPERTISLNYKEIINIESDKRIVALNDEQAVILEKYFIHKMTLYPFYDIKCENIELNNIVTELRKNDFDIELYVDVITNKKKLFDKYNLIISKKFGVIIFKCLENDLFNDRAIFDEFQTDIQRDAAYETLKCSSLLSIDGESLNIGYKKCYIFESKKEDLYYKQVNEALANKGFSTQLLLNKKMFIEMLKEIDELDGEIIIAEDEHFGILQMLMPQYVNSKTVNVDVDKIKFIPDQSYELDDNQKDVLAQINKRCYLKAAPGTGKTILLLAKAYEVASANPDKLFMIICFNPKLREDIEIQAANTGKIRANLKINTLDKFILDNFSQYDDETTDNKFEIRRKIFVEKVRNGQFAQKYGGIFIDEMQQLNEEYIAAFLELLDENKYMILAGDYYQQISPGSGYYDSEYDDDEIEENDNNVFYIGDYDFQKILLEKNYRNTEEITKVINKMVKRINEFMLELGVPFDLEEENVVTGRSVRKGEELPKYYSVNSIDEEIELIIKILIKLLRDKGYYQNEILLLSPWGNSESWKNPIIYKLEQRIKQSGIKICDFTDSGLRTDGIRVGTIGKSVGLDFKAVIIFGTSMMQRTKSFNYKIDSMKDLSLQNNIIKRDFIRYLKNIYVACSRARDVLVVIDDLNTSKGSNLITQFLKLVGVEENE